MTSIKLQAPLYIFPAFVLGKPHKCSFYKMINFPSKNILEKTTTKKEKNKGRKRKPRKKKTEGSSIASRIPSEVRDGTKFDELQGLFSKGAFCDFFGSGRKMFS